ncbi:MAG: c-type cytochrome, partial [Planctomycetota bacterium]
TSRADWSRELFNAAKTERIDRLSVPLQVVRNASLHQDKELQDLIEEIYGSIQPSASKEMTEQIARLTPVVLQRKGSPYDGQPLFNKHCGKCHQLFGKGGGIGPDLTSYQRTDVQRILENVVDPDREIREGFENHTVYTADGRVHTGLVIDRDVNVVVLKTADGRTQNIPRTEIEELSRSNRSVMPTGLLDGLTLEEIQDLFAYLRSSQPLNN